MNDIFVTYQAEPGAEHLPLKIRRGREDEIWCGNPWVAEEIGKQLLLDGSATEVRLHAGVPDSCALAIAQEPAMATQRLFLAQGRVGQRVVTKVKSW